MEQSLHTVRLAQGRYETKHELQTNTAFTIIKAKSISLLLDAYYGGCP